jgi:hypothetical protein
VRNHPKGTAAVSCCAVKGSEVKRIRSKKQPLTSTGFHALRNEHTRTIKPVRALATEALTLERTLSDLVNQLTASARQDRADVANRPAQDTYSTGHLILPRSIETFAHLRSSRLDSKQSY